MDDEELEIALESHEQNMLYELAAWQKGRAVGAEGSAERHLALAGHHAAILTALKALRP